MTGRQTGSILLSLAVLFGAYMLYERTLGRYTDYAEIDPELLQPLRDGLDVIPNDVDAARESIVSARRAFGPTCAEAARKTILNYDRKYADSEFAGRGLGIFVYFDDYKVLPKDRKKVRVEPFSLVSISPAKDGNPDHDEIRTIRAKAAVLI
ncbi:MAG: hypothetical protein ACRDD1_02745, partial [Planctomycetia bacterium]